MNDPEVFNLLLGGLLFEERDKGIVAFSTRVGGFVRGLPDGRELQIVCQVFNVRLSLGMPDDDFWDDSW